MTEKQIRAVPDRVSGGWPADRQQQLVRVVLEIAAEIAGASCRATPDELKTIDEGLNGEAASEDEISAAFASFRPA
jgi:hypothetical protein